MIKSMTGFGRERTVIAGREIVVEIRSVNHRFFDFSARTPRAYGYLDEKLKAFVQSAISRGKIEVSVVIHNQEGINADIEVNRPLAAGYLSALRGAAQELGVEDDLKLSDLTRFSDIFTIVKSEDDEEEIWSQVKQAAEAALERFVAMRTAEGEKMYEDISSRLDSIEATVAKVEELSPQQVTAYRKRLYDKLSELLQDKTIDEQRILTEAAIFADKIAVDEETVRLKSHISQFRELIRSSEPVGRRLDFLVQEMNREINTTGSKCQDLAITDMVVQMKAELEKIREQVQNVE